MFSLTDESISSIVSPMPEILSCISCILLVMLAYAVPVHLPRYCISRIPLLCLLYCLYFNFQILNCFLHLFDFYWLLGFFKEFIDFIQFFVCPFHYFFKAAFHFTLRASIILIMLDFLSFSCVGIAHSSGVILSLVLLIVFLCWPLVICVWGYYKFGADI